MPGHAAALLPFVVYVLTLAPTVTFWDSGELSAAAMDLGVAHHPGYPLYLLAAKSFTFIPLGNVAFRLAFFSAACASAAAYVLYRLLEGLAGDGAAAVSWAASCAAAAFSLTPIVWSQAVVAEVYGLHALMLCLMALGVLGYYDTGRAAFFFAVCFGFGLSMGNHHSTLFLVPAGALMVILDARLRKRPALVFTGAAFAVMGFGVNLYLPVRALAGSFINIGDPRTLHGLIWLTRWKTYGRAAARKLSDPAGTLGPVLDDPRILAVGLAALVVMAVVVYTAKRRSLTAVLLAACATSAAAVVFIMSGDKVMGSLGLHSKFYIPAAIFVLSVAFTWLGDRFVSNNKPRVNLFWALSVLTVCGLGLLLHQGYERFRNTENYYAADFARNTLKSVGEGGVLLAWGDNGVFPAWYLQGVEKYRDDALVVFTPVMVNHWYYEKIRGDVNRMYGVGVPDVAPGVAIEERIELLSGSLAGRVKICNDYTTMLRLGYSWFAFTPRGMVWLPGTTRDKHVSDDVWPRMVIRGDEPSNVSKDLVAEDIFWIYGFQAYWWGERARSEGRLNTAKSAYYKALYYGYEPALVELRLKDLASFR